MKHSTINYTCHARPAALNGRTCGHVNTNAPTFPLLGRSIAYCEECGAPKPASDHRLKEEAARARQAG